MKKLISIGMILMFLLSLGAVPAFRGDLTKAQTETSVISESGINFPSDYNQGASFTYKYVFPLVYLQPFWGTDWYGSGIEIFSIEPGTQVLIDTTFNGPDSSDPVYHISAGDRLYIGDFPDISNFQVVTWKKNPLVILLKQTHFCGLQI